MWSEPGLHLNYTIELMCSFPYQTETNSHLQRGLCLRSSVIAIHLTLVNRHCIAAAVLGLMVCVSVYASSSSVDENRLDATPRLLCISLLLDNEGWQ